MIVRHLRVPWLTLDSGYFSLAPLSCVLKVCKIDRIMYSVDYPFSMNDKGLAFVKEMQGSEMLSQEDLDLICYKNAERLLQVKAKK
jgi:predicted TIM-barrel fold metal-dependent hydrolase